MSETQPMRANADIAPSAEPIVAVEALSVRFAAQDGGETTAVGGVSFEIAAGETLALVGESGSGKSLTALSLLGLQPASARVSGRARVAGLDVLGPDGPVAQDAIRAIRGRDVGMIFQEPMTSLNPLHRVERQIGESLALHQGLSGEAARARVVELLGQVGIPDAESRLASYPHQLSGGQRQRVMIAMALANDPKLLVADEPTTALDVTIQAQILALLDDLRRRRGMAMLFITHDLNVVRKFADRVAVMQGGAIVEIGPTARVFEAPAHAYTRKLIAAEPTGRPEPAYRHAAEVLSAEGLKVWFPIKRGLLRRTVGHVKAVRDARLRLMAGETLGVVGESGSGKTTLALSLLRLIRSEGAIAFRRGRIDTLDARALRPLRAEMQIVFQDPYGSLSPRLTVEEIVAEGLDVHGPTRAGLVAGDAAGRRRRVAEALAEVGLPEDALDRYPHEFSGGQRQRIAIARALVLKPKLVVLDEPTSALDRTVQSQIVELLRALQKKYELTYLFISHDLRVVRAMAHRIMVMKDGDIVEQGDAEEVLDRPRTDYTKALMAAAFDLEASRGA